MTDDEVPTTSAAASLQQRLAALRSSTSTSTCSSAPARISWTNEIKNGAIHDLDEEEDEDLSTLLASLDVPDDSNDDDETDHLEDNVDVPIQIKNVDEQVQYLHLDSPHLTPSPNQPNDLKLKPFPSCSQIKHYLTTASQLPSTLSLPPLSSSISQKKLESTLETYEALAPNFVSPIEVSFFTPPSKNPTSGPPGGMKGDEEEEALIARLRDELSVESVVSNREGKVEDGWEKRLNKMKEFKPDTDPEKEREYAQRAKGLGQGPGLEGVEELQRRSKKGKKGSGSGSEEDTDSEEDTEDESVEE
ncbi:BQ2448_7636 [Microbotryum intermedium]|uniref:BQ2448_7636 protein n=1 Tax=Microbotryum intermedium TaxID=269621 RepID=A0A238FMU8_9BASI|nr:BQ2448_7636 [Microbotryum intermedium]